MGQYKFGKRSVKVIHTVNPILQELAARTIENSPVDLGVLNNGGLRTAEEQNQLFKASYSQCDGYKKLSYHQSGNALDLVVFIDGKPTWKNEHIKHYRDVAKVVFQAWEDLPYKDEWKLEHGGDWKKFRDYPHYQIVEKE